MLFKILQLIGFGLGGVLIAVICNVILLRFSRSLGIRNKNDVIIRWSNESKPSLGGVSFFVVFVFAPIAYSILFREDPNIFQDNNKFVGLFVAGSMAFLMGLADDAYNTRPLVKLGVQILCGVLFVLTGSSINLFHSFYPDAVLTILWVVIVMNSLNMLDNMDGITGTSVLFILISCLVSFWLFDFNTSIWSLIMVSMIGAVIGFLSMNIYPSKLFMGDAGSQFIGVFVAYFGMEYLWNVGSFHPGAAHPSWLGIFVTIIAFTPAAVDTLSVVINRLKKGQSPMVGGKDHTTHHLVYSGKTDREVWLIFLTIAAVGCILSISMVNLILLKAYMAVSLFIVYFIFVFIYLYRNTIKYPEPKN